MLNMILGNRRIRGTSVVKGVGNYLHLLFKLSATMCGTTRTFSSHLRSGHCKLSQRTACVAKGGESLLSVIFGIVRASNTVHRMRLPARPLTNFIY